MSHVIGLLCIVTSRRLAANGRLTYNNETVEWVDRSVGVYLCIGNSLHSTNDGGRASISGGTAGQGEMHCALTTSLT